MYEEYYNEGQRRSSRRERYDGDKSYLSYNNESVNNLYFENLPKVLNPSQMERDVKNSLFEYKKFFENAIRFYNNRKIEAKWELFGFYYKYELLKKEPLPKNLNEIKIKNGEEFYSILKINPRDNQISLDREINLGRKIFFSIDSKLFEITSLRKLDKTNQEKISYVWISLETTEEEIPEERLNEFFDKNTESVTCGRMEKNRIRILETKQSKDYRLLLLEKIPSDEIIYIDFNTTTLKRQRSAIYELQERPLKSHLPLIRLLLNNQIVKQKSPWERTKINDDIDWNVLTNESREGTKEQREFVLKALTTPDFAILEGPPGSGKTTTILEIISQLVKQNKRILLCASTHVAVDNVIERLKENKNTKEILVVRIASDGGKVSDKVKPYMSDEVADTERKQWIRNLQKKNSEPAIDTIRKNLKGHLETEKGKAEAEKLLWDSAQVICGTANGFLKHPLFQNTNEILDYLILDEASKTTFSEFLVPALRAKRWIIIGDYKQLAPYIEDDLILDSVQGILKETFSIQDKHEDIFSLSYLISHNVIFHKEKLPIIYILDDSKKRSEIKNFVEKIISDKDVCIDVDEMREDLQILPAAGVIFGSLKVLETVQGLIPHKVSHILKDDKNKLPDWLLRRTSKIENIRRGITLYTPLSSNTLKKDKETHFNFWANEIMWRLKRIYELRLFEKDLTDPKIKEKLANYAREIEQYYSLLNNDSEIEKKLKSTRKTCFPSILESLQNGNGIEDDRKCALFSGLPPDVLESRLVKLEYQHRMHPDISKFSRVNIYHSKALKDPVNIEDERKMQKGLYEHRVVWIHVNGEEKEKNNEKEADALISEIKKLKTFLMNVNEPFQKNCIPEIAILTFHRGQENLLRQKLRKLIQNDFANRYFTLNGDNGKLLCNMELCTVDRYQGHEADIVYLSFMKTKGVGFLDNPNRLNVALTRARYQMIIFGDRMHFKNQTVELLKNLAENSKVIHSTQERVTK